MCHLLRVWGKSFQQTLENFFVVSKHVSGETWTLEEMFIFSAPITLGKITKPWAFAQSSLGIWSVFMTFSSELIKPGAGERRPPHRQGWETWGQVVFSSSEHPGELTEKLCFSCCTEIPSLGGRCLQKCGPTGTLHKPPCSQPCHHNLGLAERSQTPTSFKISHGHAAPGSHHHCSATATGVVNCRFLFQRFSVQRARAVLIVIFPLLLICRSSNCIWPSQSEETNNMARHLETLIANYSLIIDQPSLNYGNFHYPQKSAASANVFFQLLVWSCRERVE